MNALESESTPRLVDRYGRIHDYLRVSVTDRCNLRCQYCMPDGGLLSGPRDRILTLEEIVRVVRIMATLGVRKVRLTGGEPTVRQGIERLVSEITAVPGIEIVAMTTNGVRFAEKARALRDAGLKSVNISLDSLNRETFARVTRRDELAKVLASVETALNLGFLPLKLNTVVIPGINDHELLDFVEFARERPINVRFIEYMPFRGNAWDSRGFLPSDEVKQRIEASHTLVPLPESREDSRIAANYEIPGFAGSVSFISSLTDSFCQYCSRLRLTADGSIKACLFYPAELNLRSALRDGVEEVEVATRIRASVLNKRKGHPEPELLADLNDLSMIEIGG